ncbi:winged helix-turn-helix domain-containing protein [Pseudalkalibacillus berkeleyi]|uniref:Winged helix DNA-binding domain-containing protein n=1 Tax=Pseudalkalibacillus berkeleyi TaxID=1069813 RepID=A0ABS9GYE5_9BACL|nr:crosslink repair DNA glycosylase YcaQ family protein [Pseudalkalibacillus berkeleyi]MCF6136523.1 winged helix DNA-binding domain-containing protein [Pseudalkalibacillus berkeleyi]
MIRKNDTEVVVEMTVPYPVDRVALRQFLLHKQRLLKTKVEGTTEVESVLEMLRTLECVQLDPVSVVERNQHLALAARIPGYDPKLLDQLLSDGKVFEYFANAACIIPVEDFPIFEPIRERIQTQVEEPLKKLGPVVGAVLERLSSEGPLPSRAFKSENRVHGYWDNKMPKTKESSLALNLLMDAGVIRVVHRERTERFFDITERSIPANFVKEAKTIDEADAREAMIDKYLRAYRVFDPRDARFGWQKMTAAERRAQIDRRVEKGTVIPLDVEGVDRAYYMLAEDLDELESFKDTSPVEGPITFLAPLDNLLWRRERISDLFDFDYKWEIYTPKAKRKYGPYAMPILYGDQLIGRMDPSLDRKNSTLHVRLLQLEPGVKKTSQLKREIRDALERFAKFNQVKDIVIEQSDLRIIRVKS